MLLMTLDHARDYLHVSSLTQNPTDLKHTTVALFLTRWVTHLCAPTFVFLSGVSAYLMQSKYGGSPGPLSEYLKKGLLLVALELTVVNFELWFDLRFRILFLQVIAAIGVGWVVLGIVRKRSPQVIGMMGLAIIALHGLSEFVTPRSGSAWAVIWALLFRAGIFQITPKFSFAVMYPWIPWAGVLLAGYGVGPWFTSLTSRRIWWWYAGGASLLLFVVLRALNHYGDDSPWSVQQDVLFTLLSFINTTKYPPSLDFIGMTLGVMFCLLALFNNANSRMSQVFQVFGRAPLFYYLLHLGLIHVLMIVIVLWQGHAWSSLSFAPFRFGRPEVASGLSLRGIYLFWFCFICAMYPVMRWRSRQGCRYNVVEAVGFEPTSKTPQHERLRA